jgi:carbon storage regulator CsrA
MLVLSRKQKEELVIGDQITITVLEIRGNVVKLGIEAPRDVRILRGELAQWQEHGAESRLTGELSLAGCH